MEFPPSFFSPPPLSLPLVHTERGSRLLGAALALGAFLTAVACLAREAFFLANVPPGGEWNF